MQRKSTLAYGSTGTALRSSPPPRRRRLDSTRPDVARSDVAPRSTPSSSPPSGLRLVQPRAVPRPAMSSIPPEPTSIRALTARTPLPRPARLPSIAAVVEEAELLDDADLTFVEDDVPPPRAPTPPVPWTAESTPIPANQATAIAAPPAAVTATAHVEAAPQPRWIAPPTAELGVDDLELVVRTPLEAARDRLRGAWTAASPRARAAATFAAGFVAGGLAVALL